MQDSNPGPLPQKSGALPMSHHIYILYTHIYIIIYSKTKFATLLIKGQYYEYIQIKIYINLCKACDFCTEITLHIYICTTSNDNACDQG